MRENIFTPGEQGTIFPEPPSTDEILESNADYLTCLHNAAKFEKLEEKARERGLRILADEYEEVKDTWYGLYISYEYNE